MGRRSPHAKTTNWLTRLSFLPYQQLLDRALVGRQRSRGRPDAGRFDRGDTKRLARIALRHFDALLASTPDEKTRGARLMIRNGMLSLALYRGLRDMGLSPEYATELCGDFLWAAYRAQVRLQKWFGRLSSRDPRRQMARIQRIFLRFPLGAPGYEVRARELPDGIAYDILRCPVRDYFAGQGEEALRFFRSSWCTFDYPLAEYLVPGGRYERHQTLSEGDPVCDMRWRVAPGRK